MQAGLRNPTWLNFRTKPKGMVKAFSITATLLRAALCAQAPTFSVSCAQQARCSGGTSDPEHSSCKTHGSTCSTQQQLLPHCQGLETHDQPPPYPQTAPGQSLKAPNQATSGEFRHAVVLHTLTGRQILQQKTLTQAPLNGCLLTCDPLPLYGTALACLSRSGVTRWHRGRMSVLAVPAKCREAPLFPSVQCIPVAHFRAK